MSNLERNNSPPSKGRFKFSKWKDIIIIAVLALILIIAIWRIFYKNESADVNTAIASQAEQKVSKLLAEMDGVGAAEVMICETEEGVQSVVVVCEGANSLQVIMDVREAVAAALGTQAKSVKVYLKKE